MDEHSYREKLAWFKRSEKPEVVLLVADNPQLMKIAVAWTNTEVKMCAEPGEPAGDSEADVWEWLWKNAEFSREELAARSDQSEHGFDKKLDVLIGNRVLYPDGTINSFVQRYLRQRVLKLFDPKTKKQAK